MPILCCIMISMIKIKPLTQHTGKWGFTCFGQVVPQGEVKQGVFFESNSREDAEAELFAHSELCEDCRTYVSEPLPVQDIENSIVLTDENAQILYNVLGINILDINNVFAGIISASELLCATQLALAFWDNSIEKMNNSQIVNQRKQDQNTVKTIKHDNYIPELKINETYLKEQLQQVADLATDAYLNKRKIEWYTI